MNAGITRGSGVGLGCFGQFLKNLFLSPYLSVPWRLSVSVQAHQAVVAAIILFTEGAGGQRVEAPRAGFNAVMSSWDQRVCPSKPRWIMTRSTLWLMTAPAPFGELIDVPPFLVNNALSSGDSNVIRRENKWPANDQTGPRATTPTPGCATGPSRKWSFYRYIQCFVKIFWVSRTREKAISTWNFWTGIMNLLRPVQITEKCTKSSESP